MPITDQEAADRVRAIKARLAARKAIVAAPGEADYYYEGPAHEDADQVLVDVLASLGYAETVKEFESLEKWYA